MTPLIPWSAADPWPDGAQELLIVGPPGTGKTTGLLRSYVWPVIDAGGRVLATSYTRAAAGELRARTADRTGHGPDAYRRSLSTIHSEAYRRCKHLELRLRHDRRTEQELDQDDAHAQIAAREAADSLAAWEMTRHRYPLDIGLPVRDRLARVLSGRALDLAELDVRRLVDRWYDEDGRLVNPDFTGLLELALVYGQPLDLDLLCVDEAQDCTALEWALIDRWAATADRLLVVGDPDQSVYGWAGADGHRLTQWILTGRPARYLAQSYRVPRSVHAVARSVILQIPGRVDAPYRPTADGGDIRSVTLEGAVAAVVAEPGNVLVLARTNRQCAAVVADLIGADVPHIAERGRRLLGSMTRPSRTLQIVRALSGVASGEAIDTRHALRLVTAFDARGAAWTRPRVKTALRRALADMDGFVDLADLAGLGLDVQAVAAAWAGQDLDWLHRATLARELSVGDALIVRGWLDRFGDRLLTTAARVVVTSCHASKGRQADLVVIDARGTWGAWGSRSSPEERHEDRRVLYVALTRTIDRCLVIRGAGKDWLRQQGVQLAS